MADLSAITPDHINQIPVDPQGSVSETADGTGYFIAQGSVMLVAANYETRFIGVGITEGEFTESGNGEENGNGEEFTCGDTFTDTRDGQTYATVEIGTQCWMAEDLRYDCSQAGYNNIGESESWSGSDNCGEVPGYDNIHYQWDVAMDGSTTEGAQGLCPDGWHIPTDDEFKALEMHLGMSQADADDAGWRGDQEGDMLKSDPSVEDWCNTSTDCGTSGWEGLPGGYRGTSGSLYGVSPGIGGWWSSTEGGAGAWGRSLHSSYSDILRDSLDQVYGNSVRCLRD